MTASGGSAPYTWTVTGTLPAGLALSTLSGTSASIIGTPTGVESRTFTVRAADKWAAAWTGISRSMSAAQASSSIRRPAERGDTVHPA